MSYCYSLDINWKCTVADFLDRLMRKFQNEFLGFRTNGDDNDLLCWTIMRDHYLSAASLIIYLSFVATILVSDSIEQTYPYYISSSITPPPSAFSDYRT